jgi:hypothetical protein
MPVIDARTLPPDEVEQAWALYHKRFAPVAKRAAQRHHMNRDEFDQVCADKRFFKFLAYDDDGQLVGLSTLTNDLDSMREWISVPFFARKWPDEYREGRIWYVGFVCCSARGSQNHAAFRDLLLAMNQVRDSNNGISFQDYCDSNGWLPRLTENLLALYGHPMTTELVDRQSYYLLRPAGQGAA